MLATAHAPPMNAETPLMRAIREAVTRTGRAALWRNNTGFASHERVRYGLGNGSADLVGMLVPTGRFFALEIKTAKGKLEPDQRLWLEIVRRRGGFAACVHSVDEAFAALERAERGESC